MGKGRFGRVDKPLSSYECALENRRFSRLYVLVERSLLITVNEQRAAENLRQI